MLRFSFAGFSNQTASNFYKPEKSISEIWPYFSTAVLDNLRPERSRLKGVQHECCSRSTKMSSECILSKLDSEREILKYDTFEYQITTTGKN